jgi:hypothetical protein
MRIAWLRTQKASKSASSGPSTSPSIAASSSIMASIKISSPTVKATPISTILGTLSFPWVKEMACLAAHIISCSARSGLRLARLLDSTNRPLEKNFSAAAWDKGVDSTMYFYNYCVEQRNFLCPLTVECENIDILSACFTSPILHTVSCSFFNTSQYCIFINCELYIKTCHVVVNNVSKIIKISRWSSSFHFSVFTDAERLCQL